MSEGQKKDSKKKMHVQVSFVDMPEEMVERAIRYAEDAVTKFNVEIDMAGYVKRLFDKKYEASWHVVVGR